MKSILSFLLCITIHLYANEKGIDFSTSIIVITPQMTPLEQKAVTVLQEEIHKRTGIHLKSTTNWLANSQSVIIVGQAEMLVDHQGIDTDLLKKNKVPGKEGFQLLLQKKPQPKVIVAGNDPRGVFYGVGKLLRKLYLKSDRIIVPEDLNIVTTPRYSIRGHQLGYRPKTNAYDAWSVAQFDQYIRELALFGANSIEIMPPRTDDEFTNRHMKLSALDMITKQAEICDSYDLDVWIWYPNMGMNYSHPDSINNELKERDEIFSRLKRIDVVFVPGGDPGDLHPDILFKWLKKVAGVLNKYHPQAKIWVSPQAFRPVKEWLDTFYANVNRKYSWFGGVVFGPWVKTPLAEIRNIVDKDIPIRRYPDITHSISSQYPVKDWDLAYVMTYGREGYNPRPVAEKTIHNALDQYADGSLSYSEGINDDLNKFVWSMQDWDPETPVIETLREYGRLFMHPDFSEDIAQGLLALEKNWEGPLLTNTSVEVTLEQWEQMERIASPEIRQNYRFQMALLRAYYDAYVRERLISETALEREAKEALRESRITGSESAMKKAESILRQKFEKPVALHYKERCWEIAEFLFEKIGSQTSEKKHGAQDGRGNFMDYIDTPLNDAVWFFSQFELIRKMTDENERLAAIEHLLDRTNPGPGGFYENLGHSASIPLLDDYPSWEEDPGGLRSPRVSFGVGLQGEEWVHTVEAKGFDGSATPLAWMNQVTTLYDTPLNLIYNELDPESDYILRVAYTGRFRAKIQLTADDNFPIHGFIKTGKTPLMEFPIPKDATKDGRLKLSWTCGEGERGAQLAEVWLIRQSSK